MIQKTRFLVDGDEMNESITIVEVGAYCISEHQILYLNGNITIIKNFIMFTIIGQSNLTK